MEQEKDIVERLRNASAIAEATTGVRLPMLDEAADEIERLRTELAGFYERFARELALGQGLGHIKAPASSNS